MSGVLYLCATPIGNLSDMSPRVIETLKDADLIAAEDTRNSIKLLNHFDIDTPMTSYHEFNKIEKGKILVEKLLSEKANFPDIYMACGVDDPLLGCNNDFSELLIKNKIKHTYEKGQGAHEWDFWDTYIKKALDWLPLENSISGLGSGNVGL